MEESSLPANDIEQARDQLAKRKRYSRLSMGSLWGGIIGLFIAVGIWMVLEEPLVVYIGTAVYWLGFLGMVAIQYGAPVSLSDERDEKISAEASGLTLSIIAYVFVFLTPGAVAVDATGVYTVPSVVWGVISAYVVLFMLLWITHWYSGRQYA